MERGGEKKGGFTQVYRHEMIVNGFREFAENVLENFHKPTEDKLPQIVQKAKIPLGYHQFCGGRNRIF